MSYHVLIGTRRAKTPANDIYELPSREAPDDGKRILAVGDSPLCADCGRGRLEWAEAGYVAYHRICAVCGSHWETHPLVVSGPVVATDEIRAEIAYDAESRCDTCLAWCETCEYQGKRNCPTHRDHSHWPECEYVRFIQGVGYVPIDPDEAIADSGFTWGQALALITPEMVEAALRPTEMARWPRGRVPIKVEWARRARFY